MDRGTPLNANAPAPPSGDGRPRAPQRHDGPPLDAWRPWSPLHVAELFSGLDVAWAVVGGQAIDLWLGRTTRPHSDIEVAVPRADFAAVCKRLDAYGLYAVGDGEVAVLDPGAAFPDAKHQCWVLDRAAQAWRMDVMLEPGDRDTWICRRDERIRCPRSRMIRRRDGIPHLVAEGVLLYKAKARRPKDEADFDACLPVMDAAAKAWLRAALERAHPEHPWLGRLPRTRRGPMV